MRKLQLWLLLLLCGMIGHAQSIKTVKGKIVQKADGVALPFSTIRVKDSAIGSVANADGSFRLHIPATMLEDTLIVSHVGFKNYRSCINQLTNALTIELEEAPTYLEGVSVEAHRMSGKEIFL